ncbi:MAG: Wzz/FepE/Etk N-terminal domain-containing protein [Bacteroidota bacterium]
MDILYLFKILWQRKWLLLIVGIATAALTYFLAGFIPASYKSEAIIKAGIIESSAIDLERDNPYVQQFQVSSQFENMLTRLRSRSSLRQLGYDLLAHDLQAINAGQPPFRSPEDWTATPQEQVSYLQLLQQAKIQTAPDRNTTPQLRQLAEDFGYDYDELTEQSNSYRDGATDYLKLIFTTTSADLSAFAVNQWAENFVRSYNNEQLSQEQLSVNFYTDLAKNKKIQVDSISSLIGQYKRTRRIVDLDETGNSLIAAQRDLELAREEERKRVEGLKKVVTTLDDYLADEQLKIEEEEMASLLLREGVSSMKDAKGDLVDRFNLKGRNDAELAREIELADATLDMQIEKIAAERVAKENLPSRVEEAKDLYAKRIEAEIDLLLTQESVRSLDLALASVERRTVNFVADESLLERLKGEKIILTEEYLNVVNKMNEAKRIALSSAQPLTIAEYGEVPTEPESSKRLILAVLGGILATGLAIILVIGVRLIQDYRRPENDPNFKETTT